MGEPIRPPVTYFGGKTRLASQITDAFPAHEQGGTRQERTEVLWSNRLAAPHLFSEVTSG